MNRTSGCAWGYEPPEARNQCIGRRAYRGNGFRIDSWIIIGEWRIDGFKSVVEVVRKGVSPYVIGVKQGARRGNRKCVEIARSIYSKSKGRSGARDARELSGTSIDGLGGRDVPHIINREQNGS